VGIIGAGARGVYCIGEAMARLFHETGLRPTAIQSQPFEGAVEGKAHLERKLAEHDAFAEIALCETSNELINHPAVDLVLVCTPAYAHRDPAVAALRSGKKVYLDKPIAANLEDSIDIAEEEARSPGPMLMGFTRRYELPWRKAYELLQDGAIGELQMMQIRAITPYWHYFQTWHRRRAWSGGALNDKSSHHCDVFNWFAGGAKCTAVSAMGGRTRLFQPDPNAPARCSECSRECPYRSGNKPGSAPDDMHNDSKTERMATEEIYRKDNCVYLPGSDIRDHAICSLTYSNGVKASLFWAIFGPRAEDEETFELLGATGRNVLVRHTGRITLIRDYGRKTETLDFRGENFGQSHFGADDEMIRHMRQFVEGAPPVVSGSDGLSATRMVMAIHNSIDDGGRVISMAEMADIRV